jgi:hypothetical protein
MLSLIYCKEQMILDDWDELWRLRIEPIGEEEEVANDGEESIVQSSFLRHDP